MSQNKEIKISYWAAHLTTIVSVTMVLLIIGAIAIAVAVASGETRRMRERLEFNIVMCDSVSDDAAHALVREVEAFPFTLDVMLISKKEALENWKNETGEDLETLFGVNPLSAEISFKLSADYTSPESLKALKQDLEQLPGVEGIAMPDADMVEAMNRNIERGALVLGAVAILLIIISFVLINNTVHLSIYARRFTIHTMQLVGATDGFIRRPYVWSNIGAGAVSGIAADAILIFGIWLAIRSGLSQLLNSMNTATYPAIAFGLPLAGMTICGLAAWIATSRHLRKDYDNLFR